MIVSRKCLFDIGDIVEVTREIDMFQEFIGLKGIVQNCTREDIIIKFNSGKRLITKPSNLILIEKSKVIIEAKNKQKKRKGIKAKRYFEEDYDMGDKIKDDVNEIYDV
jgi:hypothetical protein